MVRSDRSLDRRTFLQATGTGAASVAFVSGTGGGVDATSVPTGGQNGERTMGTTAAELRVGHGDRYTTLDPHRVFRASEADVIDAIYERPVARDHEGRIVGRLATDFAVDASSTELRFTIRNGVTFHDGESLLPEDVAYSFRRLARNDVGPSGTVNQTLSGVDEVSVDGDDVVLSLSSRFGSVLAVTAAQGYVLREAWDQERTSQDEYTSANGTGAFELESYDTDTVHVRRYADYWDVRPNPDAVEFVRVSDPENRLNAAADGDLDVGANVGSDLSPDAIESVSSDAVAAGPGPEIPLVQMQNDVAPFDSQSFRQALNYAVDPSTIVRDVENGFGEPLGQPVPPWVTGHDDGIDPYPTDHGQAETLVEESGYAGTEIELHVPTGRPRVRLAGEIIVAQIDSLDNVSCSIVLQEFSTLVRQVIQEDRSAGPAFYYLTWTLPSLDLGELGAAVFSSESPLSEFRDAELDELVTRAANATGAERVERLRTVSQYMHDQAAMVFLYGTYRIHGVRPDLPYRLRPDGRLDVAAMGRTPPIFEIRSVSAPDAVVAGEAVKLTVTVANTGGASGEATVTVRVDGEFLTEEVVSLDVDAERTVEFTVDTAESDAGSTTTYTVEVGDASGEATVEVLAPTTTTAQPTTEPAPTTGAAGTTTAPPAETTAPDGDEDDEDDEDGDTETEESVVDSVPGFGVLATVAGLLGAAGLRRRRADDEE